MKLNRIRQASLLAFVINFFLVSTYSNAQEDTLKVKEFKNTVRVNITNPLLFGGKAILVGYERVIGNYQTITVDVGQLTLPKLLPGTINLTDSVKLNNSSTEKGYHIDFEYRFYLPHENKYLAPRGIYLAPYVSYNYFNRKNSWVLDTQAFDGEVTTDLTLKMATIGGELGYQFILWKRVALDLVLIGPGLTNYKITAELNTSLSADDEALLFQKIDEVLSSKIPGYSLVIDDAKFKKTGTVNTTTAGFRYMIHLGFRF